MRLKSALKRFTGWAAIAAMAQPALMTVTIAHAAPRPAVTSTTGGLTTAQKVALLRQHVKYVFVIFHENESFDHYFGTFPGANGLFQAPAGLTPANATSSFNQQILNTDGSSTKMSPFLMPQAVVTTAAGTSGPAGTVVPIYPYDYISVDHGHQGMSTSLHVVNGQAYNDLYAIDNEGLTVSNWTNTSGTYNVVTSKGAPVTSVSLAAKQKAEADISHIDCDTIPFMWAWAKNFVLFDNFHQTIVGPSTPNAIAIIAGQSGQTQWALHPEQGATVSYPAGATPTPPTPDFPDYKGASYGTKLATYPGSANPAGSNAFVPVVNDPGPLPGSNNDPYAVAHPIIDPANPIATYNDDESFNNTTVSLTFASLPLSFMGSNITTVLAADQNSAVDLADVQDDIQTIKSSNKPVNWGWYQQGYHPNDSLRCNTDASYVCNTDGRPQTSPPTPNLYDGYIVHHNGPQYFGYLGDNKTVLANNLHGSEDFFNAVYNRQLPASGGVFYLRGGYNNNDNLTPIDSNPATASQFIGNDDHPAYSDQQISEAFAAKAITAIANSPYWAQSAIIITYDETDGFYDHTQINVRNKFVDGSPLAAGPRIPTIVISPWAAAGTISHSYSEHSSLIKFINTVFGLVPLADLPDEQKGVAAGNANLGQDQMGPADGETGAGANVGNMLEAFDYNRMLTNNPIPRSKAIFTDQQINTLPHLAIANPNVNPTAYSPNGYTNGACKVLNILPTDFASWSDYQAGNPIDKYPSDVNPRPTQSPGLPTSGSWQP